VIASSTPALVMVIAHFALGETLGIVSVVISITAILGFVAMLRPPFLTGAKDFDSDSLVSRLNILLEIK